MRSQTREPSGAAKQFGDFASGLVGFDDDVLFGQVWTRPALSPRDRSLVTVAALTTGGSTGQLTYRLALARQNGVTETELIEAITWPGHGDCVRDADGALTVIASSTSASGQRC